MWRGKATLDRRPIFANLPCSRKGLLSLFLHREENMLLNR
jgi:hypothetical protein